MIPSDGELMLRVRRDDLAAFDELVQRYQGSLIQFFYRHGSDRALAEDCTQEVLLKLYKSRATFLPGGSFRSFVFTIANNLWIDVVRTRRAQPAMLSTDFTAAMGASEGIATGETATPARNAEMLELGEKIGRAIAALPDEQRAVWVLAEECGLRYSEVASILRVPVGTVKSRMHFATLKLREALKSELKS
jgi:RNA polymerase sigma-70 factor (ECF subfamily)